MVRAEPLHAMARTKVVAQQLQSQVWNHDNNRLDYQVWTACRVATKQLNMLHAERPTAKAAVQSEVSRVDKNFAARLLGLLSEGARVLAQVVSHWTDGSYRPLDQRGPVASISVGSVVLH